MNMDEPFITFWFQGYKYEFVRDFIIVFDERTKKKYKIRLKHYEIPPFIITLEEIENKTTEQNGYFPKIE